MATELDALIVRIEADLGQLRREMKRAESETRRSGTRMSRSFKGLDRQIDQTTRGFGRLRTVVVGLGLGLLAREAIQIADSYRLLKTRVGLVTDSLEEQEAVFSELFRISQDTRSEFDATTTVYTRLARASGDLGLSQREILTITEALNQAIRISGASGQEASAGLIQLSQAFASNRLSGDEFRSVSEQMPRVLQAIADGSGIARSQLRKMAQEGKLTADVLADAFLNQAEKLEREFSLIPATVAEALTQLKNAISTSIGELDTTSGGTERLAGAIQAIADTVESPEFHAALDRVAASLAKILELAPKGGEDLTRLMAAGGGAFVGGVFGGPVGAVVGGTGGLALANEALGTAEAPFGIGEAAETASEQIDGLNERIAELHAKLKSLPGDVAGPSRARPTGGGTSTEDRRAAIEAEINVLLTERNALIEQERQVQEAVAKASEVDLTKKKERKKLDTVDPKILEAQQKVREALTDQNEELRLRLDLIDATSSEIETQVTLLQLEQKFSKAFADSLRGTVADNAALTAEFERQTEAREKTKQAQEDLKAAIEQTTESMAQETAELEQRLRFHGIETEELRVQLRMLELKADLGAEAAAAFEDEVRAAEGLRTQLDQIVNAREAQREATERLRSAVDQLGFSFSSAFEDAILDGKSLSDILQALEEDILRVGLRALVTEPLFGGLKAGLSGDTLAGEGGLGGLVASGVSAITPNSLKTFFAGGITNDQTAAISASAEQNIAANPEIFGALSETVEAASTGMEGLTGALAAATGGGEAAATALAGSLVTGSAEAAAGAAISGSAATAAAGGLGEVAVSAAAAAAALSSVAASAGGSSATSTLASLATAGGGLTAAEGGFISGPGTGTSDSIPARLSDGEFVVKASATRVNRRLLEAINAGQSRLAGFANGGFMGTRSGGSSSISESLQVNINIGSEVQARDLGPSIGQLRGAIVEAVEIGRARNR